jgi:hypothetical protein
MYTILHRKLYLRRQKVSLLNANNIGPGVILMQLLPRDKSLLGQYVLHFLVRYRQMNVNYVSHL